MASRAPKGALQSLLYELQPTSSRIRDVADAFVSLQEARHIADYQWYVGQSMSQARDLVELTQQAFEDLNQDRRTEAARVYGLLLLTGDISVKR